MTISMGGVTLHVYGWSVRGSPPTSQFFWASYFHGSTYSFLFIFFKSVMVPLSGKNESLCLHFQLFRFSAFGSALHFPH